jgi:hypothetical protein
MSDVPRERRSFEPITRDDLGRLGAVALTDHERFFAANPQWGSMKDRLLGAVLTQGAAAHAVDGQRGINDFDMYLIYEELSGVRFWIRRRREIDCGLTKFGKDPAGRTLNRRVDLYRRSLKGRTLLEAIQTWLGGAREGMTPGYLRTRPVVGLYPDAGEVLWMPNSDSRRSDS